MGCESDGGVGAWGGRGGVCDMAGVHQSKGSRGRRLAAPDRAPREGLVWCGAPRSGGTKAGAQLKDVNSGAFVPAAGGHAEGEI